METYGPSALYLDDTVTRQLPQCNEVLFNSVRPISIHGTGVNVAHFLNDIRSGIHLLLSHKEIV